MKALIVDLEVFCFKGELSIQDFVNLITNMYNTAYKLGIPLDRFPAYITELKDRIDALRKEIDQIEARKQDALRDYEIILELLQEYNANKPFILQMRKLKQQLEDAEEKIREGKEELEKERFWNKFKEEHTWSISVDELNKANIELGLSPLDNLDGKPSLSGGDLKEIVIDVFLLSK
jgi:predicted RNase H-like nuclease (RuvC/YqgF family)